MIVRHVLLLIASFILIQPVSSDEFSLEQYFQYDTADDLFEWDNIEGITENYDTVCVCVCVCLFYSKFQLVKLYS